MNSHHIPSPNADSSAIRDDRLHLRYPFLESEAALDDFISGWRSGTLPKSSWTHGAHVAVAACLAFDHPQEEALNLTRAGIVHFNTCVGTANTEDSGYHETLTRFWSGEIGDVKEVHSFTGGIYGGQPNIPATGPEATAAPKGLDWDMWQRIALAYPIWYEPELLACYRVHTGSETMRLRRMGGDFADEAKAIPIIERLLHD